MKDNLPIDFVAEKDQTMHTNSGHHNFVAVSIAGAHTATLQSISRYSCIKRGTITLSTGLQPLTCPPSCTQGAGQTA